MIKRAPIAPESVRWLFGRMREDGLDPEGQFLW